MKKLLKFVCITLTSVMLPSTFIPSVYATAFTDVSDDDWFYEDIKFLEKAEDAQYIFAEGWDMMEITAAVDYRPYEFADRAYVVRALHRFEGYLEPENAENDTWSVMYENDRNLDSYLWAKENGIANGYEDGEFHPEYNVTREEFVAFLVRYAEYRGYDTSGRDTLERFTDADSVSEWAYEVVSYAVHENIIRGRTETEIDPGGYTTRAEAAALLRRFIEVYDLELLPIYIGFDD